MSELFCVHCGKGSGDCSLLLRSIADYYSVFKGSGILFKKDVYDFALGDLDHLLLEADGRCDYLTFLVVHTKDEITEGVGYGSDVGSLLHNRHTFKRFLAYGVIDMSCDRYRFSAGVLGDERQTAGKSQQY